MDDENELEPSNYFSFGGQDREFIEIRVLSRASEEDYWDGNWMVCEVVLSAGGFLGGFEANIRTNEIAAFAAQVKTLYEGLKGTAILDPMVSRFPVRGSPAA